MYHMTEAEMDNWLMKSRDMARPKCRCCGCHLDFSLDPPTGRQQWTCNAPTPLRTDEEHQEAWEALPVNDVVHLMISIAD